MNTSSVEEMIFSGLDQSNPKNKQEVERVHYSVRERLEYFLGMKDAEGAIGIIDFFSVVAEISGMELAYALHFLNKHWESGFEMTTNFEDYIFERTGKSKYTVRKYIRVWELFETRKIPKDLEEEFRNRNIKELIPIAQAVYEDYSINDSTWRKLRQAPDHASIQKIVREQVKEVPARSNALTIYLERDGTIKAQKGERNPVFVGYLDTKSTDPAVVSAIERIKKGMIEQ